MSTNIGNEKAIITLEVELISSVKGDPLTTEPVEPFLGDVTPDLQEFIAEEINANIKEGIEDALGEEGVDFEEIKKMQSMVKDVDSKGISNIKNLAKSPESFMENTMMRALSRAGPHGALAATIIATIAGTPEMVRAVVEALGVKGGPLNQDFAFTEDEQIP